MNNLQKPYVFISYSHGDDISKYIKFFNRNCYNVVYDDILSYGEEWVLKVRRYINNPLCRGAVIFLSRNSIVSKAVLQELDFISLFNKNYFAVLLNDKTAAELCEGLAGDNNLDIAEGIAARFPSEQLYLRSVEFESNSPRVFETFKKWDFERDEDDNGDMLNIEVDPYSTELPDEHNRLKTQQLGYSDFDMENLVPLINGFNRDGLAVIDIGCSSGEVTYTRFSGIEKIKKVIGVDLNADDIRRANEAGYGDKFAFYCLDVESADAVNAIRDILGENGCDGIDLAFSALTLHHLKKPEMLLLRLFELLNRDGKIFLRGSDDGGKLCYPNNELLQKILNEYNAILGRASDRYNGRKLYKMLYDTGYNNISIHYSVVDTCEKTRRQKLSEVFYVGFNFRRVRLNRLAEKNAGNEKLLKRIKSLFDDIDELEKLFARRDFWYSNTSYIAIAQVN